MKAKGQARHRFWGDYSALIALSFDSAEHASKALEMLCTGWQLPEHSDTVPKLARCLLYTGSGDELDRAVAELESYGAKGVLSLKHSIDYGEPFTVEIKP